MLFENISFTSTFEGVGIYVQEHTLGYTQIFRITFKDNRNPLTVIRIPTANGKIWTSIPQGRKNEALLIGKIIENHFKS